MQVLQLRYQEWMHIPLGIQQTRFINSPGIKHQVLPAYPQQLRLS